MREGWRETTLGEVAAWYSGGTPRAGDARFYGGSIPWAVIGDLQDGQLAATANTITEDGLAQIGGRLAPPGSVLVSMYGTIGRLVIAHYPLATNQAIAWGEGFPDSVTPEYLLRWLYHQRSQLDGQARGATQRNINRRIIREFPILLPPLDEQRRIVDLIAGVDEVIEAAEAARTRLVTTALNVFQEIVADVTTWKTLGDVAIVTGGKRLPKGTPWSIKPTDHPYIRVVDLNEGVISEADLVFVPDVVWPFISRYIVREQDRRVQAVNATTAGL